MFVELLAIWRWLYASNQQAAIIRGQVCRTSIHLREDSSSCAYTVRGERSHLSSLRHHRTPAGASAVGKEHLQATKGRYTIAGTTPQCKQNKRRESAIVSTPRATRFTERATCFSPATAAQHSDALLWDGRERRHVL